MRKTLYSILTAALLALVSCGENVTPDDPQLLGEDTAVYIRAGFGTATRAVATEAEKQMKSVAFILAAEDGTLHKFFTTEALKSATGFEEVTQDASGNYAAVTLRLANGNLGVTHIAVVGNYDQCGLTSALAAAGTMDDVSALTVAAPAAGLSVPLLMYDQRTIKIAHGRATEWDGSPLNTTFSMKRVAARIDIGIGFSIDFGWGDEPKIDDLIEAGRLECFALVYNPKSQSYLFPAPAADITALPQSERYGDTTEYSDGLIRLYLYEMTGDEPDPLETYIICRYRETKNSPWTEDMRALTLVGQVSDKSRFERNHTYTPSTVSFGLSITDWDEAEWISNKP